MKKNENMKENDINNIIGQQLIPEMAIVVYKNSETDSYYIESHKINAEGQMLAGCPLTLKCISQLVESFSVEQGTVPCGIVPENLIYFDTRKGYERYVWFNPPRKRTMFFTKNLNIEDGEYCLPGIIYDTNGENLDLYSFKEKKPNMESKLFKVPLFNVTGSKVCLGNAKIKLLDNPSFASYIEYWEKKFWLSEFSHLGGSKNPTKNNLVSVTKKMKESFDCNQLIAFKKDRKILTLKDILK